MNHYEHLYSGQRSPSHGFSVVAVVTWCLQVCQKNTQVQVSHSQCVDLFLQRQDGPKSAFPLQGEPSCSTSPRESHPFPDGSGCRTPELPSCWRQRQRPPLPGRGSTTRLKSLNRWRRRRLRASCLPTARIEIIVMWVTEQRRTSRSRNYPGMETKQSAGATQCWRKIKVWKESRVSLFQDHENVTVSRVQGLESESEAGDIYCVYSVS